MTLRDKKQDHDNDGILEEGELREKHLGGEAAFGGQGGEGGILGQGNSRTEGSGAGMGDVFCSPFKRPLPRGTGVQEAGRQRERKSEPYCCVDRTESLVKPVQT